MTPASNGTPKTLVLQVEPGRYFDFVITHSKLKEILLSDNEGKHTSAWKKYAEEFEQQFNGEPNPYLSNMFGVSLTAGRSDQTFEDECLVPQRFEPISIASLMKKEPRWSPFAAASLLLALEFWQVAVDCDFKTVFGKSPVELRQFQFIDKK